MFEYTVYIEIIDKNIDTVPYLPTTVPEELFLERIGKINKNNDNVVYIVAYIKDLKLAKKILSFYKFRGFDGTICMELHTGDYFYEELSYCNI